MQKLEQGFSIFLALQSVVACGSAEDGDGSIGLGVDPNKQGQDLTADEFEAICRAVADYAQDKFDSRSVRIATCRWTAAALAAPGAEPNTMLCESTYEACTDCIDREGCEGPEPRGEVEGPGCSSPDVPQECSSTVAEIEACFTARIDQYVSPFFAAPACDELGDAPDIPHLDEGLEVPEMCEPVRKNCPEVLE